MEKRFLINILDNSPTKSTNILNRLAKEAGLIKHGVLPNPVDGKPGVMVLGPEFVDCKDAKNVHLLVVVRTSPAKRPTRAKETLCGLDRTSKIPNEPVTIYSETQIRDLCAKLQNRGVKICGNCVSIFYAD